MTLNRKGEIPPPHKTLLSTGTFLSLITALSCCYQVSLGPGCQKYIDSSVFCLSKPSKEVVCIKKVGAFPLLCVVEDCMLCKLGVQAMVYTNVLHFHAFMYCKTFLVPPCALGGIVINKLGLLLLSEFALPIC